MKTGSAKRRKDARAGAAKGLKDLEPRKHPSGGRAGAAKKEFLEIRLKEVIINGV
jgi:hypothetical protein